MIHFLAAVGRIFRKILYDIFGTQSHRTVYMNYSIWAKLRSDGWDFNFVEYYETLSNREFMALLQCMTNSIESRELSYFLNVGTRKFSFNTSTLDKMNIFEGTWALEASNLDISEVARFVEEAKQLGSFGGLDCG